MRSIWIVSAISSLSILAIFLCATNAGSIGDSTGKSVDELIDESNGIISSSNHPKSPKEARSIWSEESGIDFTSSKNDSINSTRTDSRGARSAIISGEGVSYQTAETDSPSSGANTIDSLSAISEVVSEPNAVNKINPSLRDTSSDPTSFSNAKADLSSDSISFPASMAGNWSFRLRDSKNRVMSLTLYQSEDALFGTGNINDGGESMKISASGRMDKNGLNLDATSLGTVILYRMVLAVDGSSASGDYRTFLEGEPAWNGTVEGTRQ